MAFISSIVMSAQSDGSELGTQLEGMKDDLLGLVQFQKSTEARGTKGLHTTLHAGIEAEIPFYDRLSFGLLGTHRFNGAYSFTEGRLSALV